MAVDGFGQLARLPVQLGASLEKVNRDAGHRVGRLGNEEVRREYSKLFGGDHKFSGAKHSRKAKRKATVRYKVRGDTVEIVPSGDPIYITMMGRGRSNIRPVKKRALRTPHGPRASAHGGRLAPRPDVLDPAARRIADGAAKEISKAVDAAIRKAF